MMIRSCLLLAVALGLGACKPAEDPAAVAAAQAAGKEREAEAIEKQFDAEFAEGDWAMARAQGDVLMARFPDTQAAGRVRARYDDARQKAETERETRRLASLWIYQTEAAKGGNQLSASIYAREPLDVDGSGPKPVRLIFRDHPEWGRSSYLTLEAGDFNCYGGCRLKVVVDDGKPRTMAGSRPKTDEAIAMFVEDERALWRLAKQSEKTLSIEFPVKAGGSRIAVFETGGLDATKLPAWK